MYDKVRAYQQRTGDERLMHPVPAPYPLLAAYELRVPASVGLTEQEIAEVHRLNDHIRVVVILDAEYRPYKQGGVL